ncbi:hypothetical protein D9M68_377120 [compost metagenome]
MICCKTLSFSLDCPQFLLIGVMPLLGDADQVWMLKQTILPERSRGGDIEATSQLAAHVFQQASGFLTQCLQL